MDDNLPPNNDNQQSDNPNANPPETPVAPPTVTEEIPEPKMPETPPTPAAPLVEEEKSVTYPQPEEVESEPEPEESPIEIGSLGQPSFTSYSQETTPASQDSPQKTAKPKSKKVKTMASVLGILLIITALPLSLLLVKQRQEIRKEAAVSGSTSVCGVQIGPPINEKKPENNNGTYSVDIPIKSIDGKTHSVQYEKYSCVCKEANSSACNENCRSEPGNAPNIGSTTVNISARQSDGSVCGSFQVDLFITSVDNVSTCKTK
jgi:hypothetical protein